MKKLLTFIILISHINFSMFIAQVDEVDIYDKYGQQKEDVNSLIQYVAVLCNFKHKPLKDTDDDNARYFHLVNLDYSFFNDQLTDEKKTFVNIEKVKYAPYIKNKLSTVFFDIQSPPPEV
ncbi:MAG TPA: hypothetical protein VGO09_08205 [Flavisolibacter sp.]|nr:hypothetical protein [Flavisolibacter sp.]